MNLRALNLMLAGVSTAACLGYASQALAQQDCSSIEDNTQRLACFDALASLKAQPAPSPAAVFQELDAAMTSIENGARFSGLVMKDCQLSSYYASVNPYGYVYHEIARVNLGKVDGVYAGPAVGGAHTVRLDFSGLETVTLVEATPLSGNLRDVDQEWASQLEMMLAQAVDVSEEQFEALIAAVFPLSFEAPKISVVQRVHIRHTNTDLRRGIADKFADLVDACRSENASVVTSSMADPFEISEKRCAEYDTLMCTMIEFQTPDASMTLGEFATSSNVTIDGLRELNGWGPDVTADTPMQPNRWFAFAGSF